MTSWSNNGVDHQRGGSIYSKTMKTNQSTCNSIGLVLSTITAIDIFNLLAIFGRENTNIRIRGF